jgi:TrmH RNA methyltransferase
LYRVLGTAAREGTPLDPLERSDRPIALVLGNEEDGLPRATLAACDAIVTIPGSGSVQSLNVSASAAILIHALTQRNIPSPLVGEGGARAKRGRVRG